MKVIDKSLSYNCALIKKKGMIFNMNVYTIRLPLIIISMGIIGFIIYQYAKKYSNKKKVTVFVVMIIIINQILLFPYEKYFITFPKIEKAFLYSFPFSKLQDVIFYENYGFVISKNIFNDVNILMFEQKNNQWQYYSPFSINFKYQMYQNSKIIINKIPKQNSYILFIKYPCSNTSLIQDKMQSQFVYSKKNSQACYQYTILENPSHDYYVSFNNYKVNINFTSY